MGFSAPGATAQVLLENSEPFKDLEAVSREGFKTILLAEQLLREAEAKDADCLSAVEFVFFLNYCFMLVVLPWFTVVTIIRGIPTSH